LLIKMSSQSGGASKYFTQFNIEFLFDLT